MKGKQLYNTGIYVKKIIESFEYGKITRILQRLPRESETSQTRHFSYEDEDVHWLVFYELFQELVSAVASEGKKNRNVNMKPLQGFQSSPPALSRCHPAVWAPHCALVTPDHGAGPAVETLLQITAV